MVLLITGTTGIGAAAADLALSRGHSVFLVGLSESVHPHLVGDLAVPVTAKTAVERCLALHGRIDGLFNVAGLSGRSQGDGPLHECTEGGWQFTIEANLTTMFYMSRAALRQMMEQPPDARGARGVILNMSSVLASRPEPRHFATHAYAAAKGAIESLTRSMAGYYSRHGIRVNALAPGLVRTPMSRRAQSDPALLDMIQSKQPLAGDLLDAEEIARAALFLLTPESRMVTGQILTVDGGWSFA